MTQPGDALLQARVGHALLALAFGADHLDDLPPAGDQIGQQPRRLVRQRPRLGLGRFGEVGDDRGIDRIGLGALPERLGEGADLGRIDDHDRQSGRRQRRRHDGLEAAGGLQRDDVRRQAAAAVPSAAPGRPRCARPTNASPLGRTATSRRSFDTSIPTVMMSMATRPCLIGLRALRPRRLFGFDGTTGGAPSSPTVFKDPGVYRTPARHRDPQSMRVAVMRVTRESGSIPLRLQIAEHLRPDGDHAHEQRQRRQRGGFLDPRL